MVGVVDARSHALGDGGFGVLGVPSTAAASTGIALADVAERVVVILTGAQAVLEVAAFPRDAGDGSSLTDVGLACDGEEGDGERRREKKGQQTLRRRKMRRRRRTADVAGISDVSVDGRSLTPDEGGGVDGGSAEGEDGEGGRAKHGVGVKEGERRGGVGRK